MDQLQELLKTYGADAKKLLKDKKVQEVAAIAGAVYLLSKTNKERNALIAGLASYALLPDKASKDLKAGNK